MVFHLSNSYILLQYIKASLKSLNFEKKYCKNKGKITSPCENFALQIKYLKHKIVKLVTENGDSSSLRNKIRIISSWKSTLKVASHSCMFINNCETLEQ